MESFFHTLKTELVMHCDYKTRDDARVSLFDYMEVFYNRQRRHSAAGAAIQSRLVNWRSRPTPAAQPRRPNCPEAVVRRGSVSLRSAGEVKFPTGGSLFLPLRSVTGAMREHFHQP